MTNQPARSGVEAAEKFALTLAASLILHFALIFGLQIRAAPAASQVSQVIQARLVDVPAAATAPPPPETDSLVLQSSEPVPVLPSEPVASDGVEIPPPPGAEVPENNPDLPSIEVPMIEDTTYYTAKEVDVHPTALQVIQPRYPDEAAKDKVSGSVVLLLLLDESGKVQEISVEESIPSGIFDQSAIEAFRNAPFSPAQRHGRVVKSRVRIKINYEFSDGKDSVDMEKQK